MTVSRVLAQHILSDTDISPRCQRIASYWLSLWDDNVSLPTRGAIAPSQIKPLLSGIIVFQVVPGRSAHVRMAGTDFCTLLKFEPTGMDWLAITPAADRTERLRVFSSVARGAIGRNRWRFLRPGADDAGCDKLLLPLKPEGGGIPILGFVDWSAVRHAGTGPRSLQAIGVPRALEDIPVHKGGGAP